MTAFQWTPDVIQDCAERWKNGESSSQIADALGVSRNSVLGVMNRNRDMFPKLGTTTRNGIQKAVIEKASRLWKENMSVEVIALEMGMTKGQVSGMTKRNRDKFPSRQNKRGSISLHTIRVKKSPRNDKVNRLSKFNPNAGSKAAWYEDPVLDEYELSRLPGVSLVDNDGCMYPLSGEKDLTLFCGHSRFKGRYCEYHTEKCTGYNGYNVSYKKSYDKNIIWGESV